MITGFTQEWERRINTFTGATAREIRKSYNDISSSEKRWSAVAKTIAAQNINATRFYLMRRLEGVEFNGQVFPQVTMEQAIAAEPAQLDRYVQAYAEIASQSNDSGHQPDYWSDCFHDLIIENRRMNRPAYLNVLLALRFELDEANDFLLRVSGEPLNLKSVGTKNNPGDLIYAFAFGTHGTYAGTVKPLKARLSGMDFPKTSLQTRVSNGTEMVNADFMPLIMQANSAAEDRRNDIFISWVSKNKSILCTDISYSASIVFGRLLSILSAKCSAGTIPHPEEDPDFPDPDGSSLLQQEFDDLICIPDFGDSGKNVLRPLTSAELDRVLDRLDSMECTDTWSYVIYDSTSRNKNSEHLLNKAALKSLASGRKKVTRNDIMFITWCICLTHWNRYGGTMREENAVKRMKCFRARTNEALTKAGMQEMYVPHMLEYALLSSIRECRYAPDYFDVLSDDMWDAVRAHEDGDAPQTSDIGAGD